MKHLFGAMLNGVSNKVSNSNGVNSNNSPNSRKTHLARVSNSNGVNSNLLLQGI